MPASRLDGKSALVTGGAVRVGRAIALALADAGADVGLHYRASSREAEETAAEIRALGRRSAIVAGDLEKPEDCRRAVREAVAAFSGLDLLVLSAANFHQAPLSETDEALWDSSLNVNARSGFLMAREAAPTLTVIASEWR